MKTKILIGVMGLFALAMGQEKLIQGQSQPGSLSIRFVPPALAMQASFTDQNGNNALDAEETGTLRVVVSNTGEGKAYNLTLRLAKQTVGSAVTLSRTAGNIPVLMPGEKKNLEFPLKAAFSVSDGRMGLLVSATEKNQHEPAPLEITLETRAFVPPQLILADAGINDEQGTYAYGNGNGKIEKGETIEIKAIVQNSGQGDAGRVEAVVTLDESALFYMGKRSFHLGDLAAGEYREIGFALTVPPNYSGPAQLPVSLKIKEVRGRYGSEKSLDLVLNQTARRSTQVAARQVNITGRAREQVDIEAPPSLTVDVDVEIPRTTVKKTSAVAVVIGNRDYQVSDVPDVDFAIRDAVIVKEYLIQMLGYSEDNIIYLTNATRAQIDAALGTASDHRGRLFNYLQSGQADEVFVYYSGHGAPDPQTKKAYLVPTDADPAYVRLNGYALDTFYKNLNSLPTSKITVVLDACFSGASESGMLIQQASPVFVNVKNPALMGQNSVVFTSSRANQISSWYADKRHGLFTYYFLKALKGEADQDGNRKVTVAEIDAYLQDFVPRMARRLHAREQMPELLMQGDHSDRVMTIIQ